MREHLSYISAKPALLIAEHYNEVIRARDNLTYIRISMWQSVSGAPLPPLYTLMSMLRAPIKVQEQVCECKHGQQASNLFRR